MDFDFNLNCFKKHDLKSSESFLNRKIQTNIFSYNKELVCSVIESKNLKSYNWFVFCLGAISKFTETESSSDTGALEFLVSKCIDDVKSKLNSGIFTKSFVAKTGWFVVGYKSFSESVLEKQKNEEKISYRKNISLKKKGEILESDKNLLKIIAKNNNYTLIMIEPVPFEKEKLDSRHRLLCKYGKGTSWCTANPKGGAHESYNDVPIYIVLNSIEQPIFQFTHGEFKDHDNDPVYHSGCLDKNLYNFLLESTKDLSVFYDVDEDDYDDEDDEDEDYDEDEDEDEDDDEDDYEDEDDEDDYEDEDDEDDYEDEDDEDDYDDDDDEDDYDDDYDDF